MAYSEEKKRRALEVLAANKGNLYRTSVQTGISWATLRRWAREMEMEVEQEAMEDPSEVLDELLRQLLVDARAMAQMLREMNGSVTFNQRANALNQLLDKIIKLMERMPQVGGKEQVIRIEYVDPDGSVHEAPYWARGDSEEGGEVSGGGVWSPFWQDRAGEDDDR